MLLFKSVFILILSYLFGSISSSVIISKIMTGDDLRNHGSGNAGATNALRVLGKKGGILTLLGDVLKTVLSILLAIFILNEDKSLAIYFAGIGTVIGHNYPIWFGFKGGKGIVVSITAILFADWKIGIIVMLISIIIMAITKYVSLGSVLGAVLCIILSIIFRWGNWYFVVFTFVVGLLAIFRHKANIIRLINGEESKLSLSKK